MPGEPRIIREAMTAAEVRRLADETFGDMVKIVVDVDKGSLAAGGMLHADSEALLIEEASEQSNLWGANYFPNKDQGSRLEYTALINIRPEDEDPDQYLRSESLREKVREAVERWMGPA